MAVRGTVEWYGQAPAALDRATEAVEAPVERQVPHMFAIIGFIVFGLVVGVLARLIKPGKQNLSLVATLLLGLAGSVIGGIVASALGTGDIFELNILGAIVAIVAAVLLIGVAEGLSGRNKGARV